MNEIRDLIIGIDLGEKFSQICYYDRKAGEPRSLPVKVGSSVFEMPTVLSRMPDSEEFAAGEEAEYAAREKNGFLIENLYQIVGRQERLQVFDEEKESFELAAIFLSALLKLLGMADVPRQTRCLVITSPDLSPRRVKNYQNACALLGFSPEQVMLVDYGESFFYYVFAQKRENWNRSVGWYAFDRDRVTFRKMAMNTAKRPVPVWIEKPRTEELPADPQDKDLIFASFVVDSLGAELYSSIMITGEGFSQDWAAKSVGVLCAKKRKVYFGNNLFARGACSAAVERLEARRLTGYRFLSPSLVHTSIGMDLRVMGAPTWVPLIEAGRNWYECRANCELILDDTRELVFTLSSLEFQDKKRVSMSLPGLPERPNKTTRLSLELEFVSPAECEITVRDLGFGELFPSSGLEWKERARV